MHITFARSLTALALCAAAAAATAAPADYEIDPTHTSATFEISHFGASVNRGRFDKKEGSLQLDRAAKKGKVEVSFDIDSVSTGVADFDKHLKSAEIFDTANHPKATFVGDRFTFKGDKLASVAGTLTIKGKSEPVTFKAKQFACYDSPMLKREVCGGDFEATIDRTKFGLDYGVQFGISKQVRIVATIEAAKK